MIIASAKQFLIEFKINNPSDSDTHYVRAVIKNAISGATISTLNLTDNGSGYFSKEWMTPNDSTGNGLQVSVMTTVYDDAGYTSESLAYGSTLEQFIVRDLAGPHFGIGGAGAGMGPRMQTETINYRKIKEMIDEAIAGIKFPEPLENEKYDDATVLRRLNEIENSIFVLDEKPEPADKSDEIINKILSAPQFKLLEKLPAGFEAAEVSDDELHSYVEEVVNKIDSKLEEAKKSLEEIGTKMEESISSTIEDFKKNIGDALQQPIKIETQTPRVSMEKKKEPEPTASSPHQRSIEQLINGY